MKKLIFIASSEMTIRAFLAPHIRKLSDDYKVYIIFNNTNMVMPDDLKLKVDIIDVPIQRNISVINDIRALLQLFFLFRRLKPEAILSMSPKAGLLSMLAGAVAQVPIRIHFFTGQIWKTKKGLARLILKLIDRILAFSTTISLVDSKSQLRFLVEQNIVNVENSMVLADGSVCGVNISRFNDEHDVKAEVRKELGLSDNVVVFLYLGRLKRDKGVQDLSEAFKLATNEFPDIHLLIIGPDEEDMLPHMKKTLLNVISKCTFHKYTNQPEKYMAAADIFCLPSYREGFGSVIIEAAACGIPALGSNIYGIEDAIVDGETGLLFPAGNIHLIHECMKKMITSSEFRMQLGKNAKVRAHKLFSEERLTSAMQEFIKTSLK